MLLWRFYSEKGESLGFSASSELSFLLNQTYSPWYYFQGLSQLITSHSLLRNQHKAPRHLQNSILDSTGKSTWLLACCLSFLGWILPKYLVKRYYPSSNPFLKHICCDFKDKAIASYLLPFLWLYSLFILFWEYHVLTFQIRVFFVDETFSPNFQLLLKILFTNKLPNL